MNVLTRYSRPTIDPMTELERLHGEINRLFEPDFDSARSGIFDRSVSPAVDVEEDADNFVVTVELPGISSKDIDLSIADNVLTIKGERKGPEKKGKQYRNEFWYGTFHRTVGLPKAVDPDRVSANMTDGVLAITVPKREEVKPKQITVKVK